MAMALGKTLTLSIYVTIMKGEYDAILPWPFRKKVTFTLIDQQEDPNDRENINMTLSANPKTKVSIAKPVTEENYGRGFPQFVSQIKLQERRYIVDDTIFIQVQLAPPQ